MDIQIRPEDILANQALKYNCQVHHLYVEAKVNQSQRSIKLWSSETAKGTGERMGNRRGTGTYLHENSTFCSLTQ